MIAVRVENIFKSYISQSKDRKIQALSDVSFDLEKGEILGVVGESGCGKSTLTRIIAGLEKPDSGTVSIQGKPLEVIARYNAKDRTRVVQLVFQDPYSSLNPRQTVFQAIHEVVRIYEPNLAKDQAVERVHQLLSQVGISNDLASRYPSSIFWGPTAAYLHCTFIGGQS